MTKPFLYLVFLCSILCFACGDDGNETTLNYDGENVTGPIFIDGQFVTAARFQANLMNVYQGRELSSVELYMLEIPDFAELILFSGDGSGNPTNVISTQDIRSLLQRNSWNTINLSSPYIIDGEELWIAVDFRVTGQQMIIGCDAGPRNPNGDRLFTDNDNWTTYNAFTGTESINWNIRGVLSPQ